MLPTLALLICPMQGPPPPSVMGQWDVSYYEAGGTTIHCNACPTFTFNRDNTGSIVAGDGSPASFTWKQQGATVWVYATQQSERAGLPSGTYQLGRRSIAPGLQTIVLARADKYRVVLSAVKP